MLGWGAERGWGGGFPRLSGSGCLAPSCLSPPSVSPTQHTSLEAQMCQVESRYLVLLQERKTPVCSEEPNPDSGLVAQLLEDALKVDSGEQPGQAYFKPHMVR